MGWDRPATHSIDLNWSQNASQKQILVYFQGILGPVEANGVGHGLGLRQKEPLVPP